MKDLPVKIIIEQGIEITQLRMRIERLEKKEQKHVFDIDLFGLVNELNKHQKRRWFDFIKPVRL